MPRVICFALAHFHYSLGRRHACYGQAHSRCCQVHRGDEHVCSQLNLSSQLPSSVYISSLLPLLCELTA
jgi:hypothetical protein